MKIAYKGFDKDLKCRTEQFQIGATYTKTIIKENPALCTADGWHYCDKLKNCFQYYPNNGSNRFCEIEVIGPYTDNGGKSITTSFRIIKEIDKNSLEEMTLEENLNIETVKNIQEKYPMFHVGGSVGLFLHGVRLSRWKKSSSSDLDMISPYYVLPESKEGFSVDFVGEKASGNDFDDTFMVDGVKVDYRIDPKQKYEIINYKGFKYKVSPLLTILEAKIKYAMNGDQKHKKDIKEMITKIPQRSDESILDIFS